MAMSVDSIRNVEDENTYLLLSEPKFIIIGKLYDILSGDELKLERIPNTAGITTDDYIQEERSIECAISKMCGMVSREVYFDLERVSDARLIYTCIDQFMMAQSRLITKQHSTVGMEMIDDFRNLTKLANYMLSFITVADRIDLMNAPVVEDVPYGNIFDRFKTIPQITTMSPNPDVEITSVDESYVPSDEDYQSPFTSLIQRAGTNRVNRFV